MRTMRCHEPEPIGTAAGRKIHHVSLLGGASNHHLEKYVDDNGKDDIPYEMENKSHVPNHQPDDIYPNQLIYIYKYRTVSSMKLIDTPCVPHRTEHISAFELAVGSVFCPRMS